MLNIHAFEGTEASSQVSLRDMVSSGNEKLATGFYFSWFPIFGQAGFSMTMFEENGEHVSLITAKQIESNQLKRKNELEKENLLKTRDFFLKNLTNIKMSLEQIKMLAKSHTQEERISEVDLEKYIVLREKMIFRLSTQNTSFEMYEGIVEFTNIANAEFLRILQKENINFKSASDLSDVEKNQIVINFADAGLRALIVLSPKNDLETGIIKQ
jgi:hypothetical protein